MYLEPVTVTCKGTVLEILNWNQGECNCSGQIMKLLFLTEIVIKWAKSAAIL